MQEITIKVTFADAAKLDVATAARIETNRMFLAGALLDAGRRIVDESNNTSKEKSCC